MIPPPDNAVARDILRLCEEYDREWTVEGWQTVLNGRVWQLRASPSGLHGTLDVGVSVTRRGSPSGSTIPFLLQIDNNLDTLHQEEGKRPVRSHFNSGDVRSWVAQAIARALAWFDEKEGVEFPTVEREPDAHCLGPSFWED